VQLWVKYLRLAGKAGLPEAFCHLVRSCICRRPVQHNNGDQIHPVAHALCRAQLHRRSARLTPATWVYSTPQRVGRCWGCRWCPPRLEGGGGGSRVRSTSACAPHGGDCCATASCGAVSPSSPPCGTSTASLACAREAAQTWPCGCTVDTATSQDKQNTKVSQRAHTPHPGDHTHRVKNLVLCDTCALPSNRGGTLQQHRHHHRPRPALKAACHG